MHPGADQAIGDLLGPVAIDTAHHHHAQVQVGVEAHRGFNRRSTPTVFVNITKFIFSDKPAQAKAKGRTIVGGLHFLHRGDRFRLKDLVIPITPAVQMHLQEMGEVTGRAEQPAPGR